MPPQTPVHVFPFTDTHDSAGVNLVRFTRTTTRVFVTVRVRHFTTVRTFVTVFKQEYAPVCT